MDLNQDKQWGHLQLIIQKSLEGTLSPDEAAILQDNLRRSAEARQVYIDYMMVHGSLFQMSNEIIPPISHTNPAEINQALLALSEQERTAPGIEVPAEVERELIQKVVYAPKEKQSISKFSIISLIASAAAVLFIVLFVKIAPPKHSVAVATLIDQVNTEWIGSDAPWENGSRLWTNASTRHLNKGILEIRYDDGVDLLIEAPAAFVIQKSGIYLEYGRAYSRVSKTAIGFTISTPTSVCIDLGTEFGVQADVNGSTEVHVLDGNVQLIAGSQGNNRSSQRVSRNQAARYDVHTRLVHSVPVMKKTFVRQVDSDAGMIWRGQTEINLGNILSGGNGLTPVSRPTCINPATGELSTGIHLTNPASDFAYHPVNDNRFVDGVFIPGNKNGAPQVTSAGDVFEDCPSTNNQARTEVFSSEYFKDGKGKFLGEFLKALKETDQDAVLMHANAGVTFDLEKIRSANSFGLIKEFRTSCFYDPMPEVEFHKENEFFEFGAVDFWVLVDGEVRYQNNDVEGSDAMLPVQLDISDQDRFLTLVVTDSNDKSTRDWGCFMDPVLIVEQN